MSNEYEKQELDNPLVVHDKNDASYYDLRENMEMEETLVIDNDDALERHRYKKDPNKKNRKWIILLVVILIIAGVFAGLYFTGNIKFNNNTEVTETETTTEAFTTLQQAYDGTIVIKDTYIFVDGIEVDGIQGLETVLKYTEPSETAFVIINDKANDTFLINEVLPILMNLGFYGENTEIKHPQVETALTHTEVTTNADQALDTTTTTQE